MQGGEAASEYTKSNVEIEKKNMRDIEYSFVMQFRINVFDPENKRVCKIIISS